jgi:hypothetical protein
VQFVKSVKTKIRNEVMHPQNNSLCNTAVMSVIIKFKYKKKAR